MSATSVVVMLQKAGEHPGIAQRFHRPAADAGGVEDQAVVVGFQTFGHCLHARRSYAEHRDPKSRPGYLALSLVSLACGHLRNHTGERMRGIAEYLAP